MIKYEINGWSATHLRYSLRSLLIATFVVALAVLAYREFYVPPLNMISGLSVEKESKRGAEVLFDESATLQTVEQMLAHLTKGSMLWFYDSHREALSDPGVFVTITPRDGDYLVEFSNHGWSTDWVLVPREELIQYLWACRRDNQKGKSRFYTTAGMRLWVDENPTIRIDEASTAEIRRYIRDRIDGTR